LAVTKTEVVSVRVPPDVKAALVAAAEQERRSLATMVEVMVLEYCKAHRIAQEQAAAGRLPARTRGVAKSTA
jgi:hypothetical protein